MGLIKGTTITLIERTESGSDIFGQPTYTESTTTAENILIIADAEADSVSSDSLHGAKQTIQIGIPKSDSHNWWRCSVVWKGNTYDQTGEIKQAEADKCPLDWDRVARAERYV